MNIRTIVLVILGLVLVSAIVLSTTALAAVLILGDLHWKRVLLAFGCWFLATSLQQCIAAASRDAHPAAIIREANTMRRAACRD
jgi:type IV secretory pathway TrbD component